MRFLAVVARKIDQFSEAEIEPVLAPEAERVRELYTQGIFRSVSSRGDVKGAVVELECAAEPEARAILATLPLAVAGMIDIQLIPLLPYRGFAPLAAPAQPTLASSKTGN